MFRGATSLSLDIKGRLAVPAKHRDALLSRGNGALVLTAHTHGCLLLYAEPDWEPVQQNLMSLSSFDPHASKLQRVMVGFAEDVLLDSAGRLLISPALREVAGLERQVMFVGLGSRYEIWNIEKWRDQVRQVMENESELPAELNGFSL